MTKKTAVCLASLALIAVMMISPFSVAQGDWPVSEGDTYRWTTYDRYYDITDEDTDIEADSQTVDITPITYTIQYSNATQGAHAVHGGAISDGRVYLDIESNAYAIQVWGYPPFQLNPFGSGLDMQLLVSRDNTEGDYSTENLDHPRYDKDDYPDYFYPTANYTIALLSRYEYEFLDDYYSTLESQGEVDIDYYDDVLGNGDMFKYGKLIDFQVYITNKTEDPNDMNTISSTADAESYSLSYDRYAHTDDLLSLQVDTDSTTATKVKLGIIYSDLISFDRIIFEKSLTLSEGFTSFDMYSALENMDSSIRVSPDRIYQGPAARLVTVYVTIYNEVDQSFFDTIDPTKGGSNRIEPETNKTLLGFFAYNARFLDSEFEYDELDTEYTMGHIEMHIKDIEDKDMDSDDKDDVEYTMDLILESESPVEVSIPNYMDVGIIAPILSLLASSDNEFPPELDAHGVYVPSAINYLYSNPVDNIEAIIDELLDSVSSDPPTEPEIDLFLVGEIIATLSMSNLLIVPTDFDYEDVEDLLLEAIDLLVMMQNESMYQEAYDMDIFWDIPSFIDFDGSDSGNGAFNASIENNVMPYFYDIHCGPSQVGFNAIWSDGFFQKCEVIIYQPQVNQVRVISFEKTEVPNTLTEIIAWILFILGLIGIPLGAGLVYRKVKKAKKADLDCDPSLGGDCKL